MPNTSVFISYARENVESARRAYHKLKEAGHSPWMDEVDVLPGQNWKDAVQAAIHKCRFFLALLSRRSTARKGYVQTELSRALEELDSFPDSQIYLIPARLDDCDVPRQRLRELHWVDLFPDWDAGMAKILRTIEDSWYASDYHYESKAPLDDLKHIMDIVDSAPYGDREKRSEEWYQMSMSRIPDSICKAIRDAPTRSSPEDPNAEEWAIVQTRPTQHETIDGFWSSRWRTDKSHDWHNGTALIRSAGEWVSIEVQDETSQYVIRARREEPSRLVGRYLNCSGPFDTTPWLGLIVDDTRIDGFWDDMNKRWDFRRRRI